MLEGPQSLTLGLVIDGDLFVEVSVFTQPIVWAYTCDWGWLVLVAAGNDLNTCLVEPVQKGLENGTCSSLGL